MLGISREMRRYRDELFTAAGRPIPRGSREVIEAMCGHIAARTGRELRVAFERFPPDTVSGLWMDLGDFELIVVEADTSPLHQLVIAGHELWHQKEGHCGHHAVDAGLSAAARGIGDRWDIDEAIAQVAARGHQDDDEERRAETFGRLLASRFRPHLGGKRSGPPTGGVAGRVRVALEG